MTTQTPQTGVESALDQNPLRAGLRRPRTPEPCTMVIFGATGDLTKRKLFPALYNLALQHLLPTGFSVVGYSRQDIPDEDFRSRMRDAINQYSRNKPAKPAVWDSFEQGIFYQQGGFDDQSKFDGLAQRLDAIDNQRGTLGNRLYYLATPPSFFSDIINRIGKAGLGRERGPDHGWSRIVIEKPFGRDLETAKGLNQEVHQVFDEDQVYRIDHYLGKETVQNILVFRFGNGIFEPIWNRRYIDNVQITVAESIGIEGRGGYYEEAGALRDMVENHMMQLLALVAMEPPVAFDPNAVRDEKAKLFHSVRPIHRDEVNTYTVRGQYGDGWVGDQHVQAYRSEQGVAKDSDRETYVALKLFIENWRWAGVPFYLRHGKALPRRATEIAITFKRAPQGLFSRITGEPPEANVLVLRIQPDEGIELKFAAKIPGPVVQLREVNMDFLYGASFAVESPDAYETLLLDCMLGDSSLFTRNDEVEAGWRVYTEILEGWKQTPPPAFPNYAAGTWGPAEADQLIERDGYEWRRP
ncbi:MAG: glucose-6-phosphate dehydrogenase [Dehalococcoidia bacterium]